jgi:hypothetical protein
MKTLNNNIGMKLNLLSIITTILLTQSCSKENNNSQSYNPQKYYFYLTTAQLNQTPYFTNKAFDTINFASDKGDTLTFVKTKTDTSWYCERTTSNPDNNDQNCYQSLHNTYTTIKGNGSFDVKHLRKGNVNFLNYLVPNIITINFNSLYFVFAESVIGDNNYKNFIGDIKIKNKTFSNTFYEYHNSNQSNNIKGFFSKPYGLIEIKDSTDNKIWLLNI